MGRRRSISKFLPVRRYPSSRRGQLVLEVLIALAIMVVIIAAAITVIFSGQSLSVDSELSNQALSLARQNLETAAAVGKNDFGALTSSSSTGNGFVQEVIIESVDARTKKITSRVSWSTDPLRQQRVELTTYVTDWQSLLLGGCESDPLSGNWAVPRVLGSADLGAGNQGTDVVVRLPYVYVSGVAATASKPDIFVFNVSNPASPVLVNSLDVGSGGINSIFIKGDYLYAASSNDNQELLVFNIANPPSISLVGTLNLSGSADGLGITAFGSTSTVTAAVGRAESATYELVFVNVSDPAHPTIINQVATGGDVHDFYASQTRLYLTSEQSDEDVWIYDISNPSNPTFVMNYDVPGSTEDISVSLQQRGGINILDGNKENELIVISASTSQMYVRNRISLGGQVNDIVCVVGDLYFLATTNSTKEFIIVNGSNPDNIAEYAFLNFPQVGTGIDYAQNMVFFSVRSNDALRIITSSP